MGLFYAELGAFMDITVKFAALESLTGALVVAHMNDKLGENAKALDSLTSGKVKKIIKKAGTNQILGQHITEFASKPLKAERLVLVNAGKHKELNGVKYKELIQSTLDTLNNTGVSQAQLTLTDLPVAEQNLSWKITQLVLGAYNADYCFDDFKTKPSPRKSLKKITLIISDKDTLKEAKLALKNAKAIAQGMILAKNLANTPPNICNPAYLGQTAKALAKEFSSLKVTVIDEPQLKKLKMNTLLAVGRGSKQETKLITLEHQGGAKDEQPIVLVGKGITFDTGGISLKPPASMIGMKYDMSGAASVLGTMRAVALLNLPINILGIVPSAENMPDGDALRPEDVITSMSGLTIEITNTDAEGRLILCDALTYAKRFNPKALIDVATLTGAIVVALGSDNSGLFCNDDQLTNDLVNAGKQTDDTIWPMPVGGAYDRHLKSATADILNAPSTREASSVTAACFLAKFIENCPWAHLDIAGTARQKESMTGRPVPLLVQYLINQT